MRTGLFCAGCALLGAYLGLAVYLLVVQALTAEAALPWQPSPRDVSDFTADVESYLRAEGY